MKNIVLIGMPGCGKSTLGVLLAKALGLDFVDTDLLIQNRTGKLLYKIVEEYGKEAFLDIERDAIASLDCTGCVIATGGSAVLREKAMEHLKSNGVIVYLSLPYNAVEHRIKNIKTRGIAFGKGETLKDLYNERIPYYERYGDITLNCEGKSIEGNVEEIIKELEMHGIYPATRY